MRTAAEIELFPMAQDLIDIITLSRIFADQNGLALGESCELATSAVVHGGEIVEVYRTDKPGLPICFGELNGNYDDSQILKAFWMPFKSRWWENPSNLAAIQPDWGGTPDSLAIRRTDAERLLDITLDDQVKQAELPTQSSVSRSRKHCLDHAIRHAKNQCSDPDEIGSVWVALVNLAKAKSDGLLGVTEGGIQYLDANDQGQEFSKKSLTAYLKGSNLNRKRPRKSA